MDDRTAAHIALCIGRASAILRVLTNWEGSHLSSWEMDLLESARDSLLEAEGVIAPTAPEPTEDE